MFYSIVTTENADTITQYALGSTRSYLKSTVGRRVKLAVSVKVKDKGEVT